MDIVPTGSQIQVLREYKKVNCCGPLADLLRHIDNVPYSMPFFSPRKGKTHRKCSFNKDHLANITRYIFKHRSRIWSGWGPKKILRRFCRSRVPGPDFPSKSSSCVYVDLHYYIAEIDLYFSTQKQSGHFGNSFSLGEIEMYSIVLDLFGKYIALY